MHRRSTRLLAALPVAVAAALVLAPAAHATTTPQPAPPISDATTAAPVPAEATPATGPAPETRPAQPQPADPPTGATRPAEPGQVSRVPVGAPETGGGATADDGSRETALLVLGGLGLAGAGTALVLRRRTGAAPADRG